MIFLNLLNRIFGPKGPLSRQEIDDYKKGTGDSHEIDSKTANSEFNEKALEGWKSSKKSVNEEMASADKKMNDFIGNANGTSNKGMTLSFILFSLTMIVLIIFTYQGNSAVDKKPQITQVQSKGEKIEKSRSKEIDFYTAISDDKQITSNELIKVQDKKLINPKVDDLNPLKIKEIENELPIEKDGTKSDKILLPIQSTGKIENKSKNHLVYKNAKEIYLSELKNVDYRAYRDRPIKVRNTLEVGIPASQSSKEDKPEFPSLQITEYSYIDYLAHSSKNFSSGEFKNALKQYLKILDFYPNDVNANFYGGLCYFNLGKFDKAIELLKKSYTLSYGNFREEAQWFSAKAHTEQDNYSEAKKILKNIIQENGFYKERAIALMNDL